MSAKPIKSILDNAPEVRALTLQTRRLLRLQQVLRAALPENIASQVAVASLISGNLSLTTNSGATAAKIRQLTPSLLKKLRLEDRELNALKVLVQVPIHHNPLPKKQIFLDNTGRNALLTLSKRIESASLRTAIVKLASRFQPSDNKQESLEEIDPDED
ncbi:MAG TPA: DciA family protein [Burkholderiales bacterium]|nr:DciA family protein [Burkholderiales bacterium]